MKQPTQVAAVHENDVAALLELLGVSQSYYTGAILCAICGISLKEVGLGAMSEKNGELEFVCEQLNCLGEFHTR